ncbi:MAG: hypothetical protein EYC70_08210 [Planctomycetota bacterium]|nr:MAG: hypothetical protein EYC70_08210 [Planctomycetota bacterium]
MNVQNQSVAGRPYRGMLAIEVDTPERLAFLRKVYSLFGAAMAVFAATAWWGTTSATAQRLLAPIFSMGILGPILVMIGLFLMLRATASRYPLNVVALVAVAGLEGLLTAPLLLYVLSVDPVAGGGIIAKASIMTVVVFGGLTLYTLTTRADFSWMRAALWIGFAILFGFSLLGLLFGWDTTGFGISLAWIVLMAGFTVYDTNTIMHRYPTSMAAAAAATLFIDFVLMFQRMLLLLTSRRD